MTPRRSEHRRAASLAENLPAAIALGTLAVITVAAFLTRNPERPEVPAPAGAAAVSGAPQEITFSIPAGAEDALAFDQLIRSFGRGRPDVRVRFNPAASGRPFHTVIGTLMNGRKAPDVFFFEDEPFEEFACDGAFLPLDAYIRRDNYDIDDFFEKARQEFVIDGVTYGLSQGWGAIILVYNKDLFEERGVTYSDDWTWDDFMKVCERLTFDRDGDGDIDVYAFAGVRNFDHACIAIWSAGAEVQTPDKSRWTLTDERVVKAFEWWCSLWQSGYTPLGARNNDAVFSTLRSPFFEGRVAMLECGAYYCGEMRGYTRFRWGVGYLPKCPYGDNGRPRRVTRLYGDSYVIWDKYPPNWMVNDGLLTRAVVALMRPEVQRHVVGVGDAARLTDAEFDQALKNRKTEMKAAVLAEELLRLWGTPPGRAAMNDKLREEMKRRDAAWEFLKYLAGPPGERMVARMGRSTPGRKSVAYSRYFNREDTPYDENRITDAIQFAHLQPLTRQYDEVRRVYAKYVDRIFLRESGVFKKLTPREALELMEKELNAMLQADRKKK